MKDDYPLAAVLSLRRLERDERVQDLQSAQARFEDCRRRLEEARAAEKQARMVLKKASRERLRRERAGMLASDLQARVRHQEALERELERTVLEVDTARSASRRASRALEGARERLARAQSEMRAVEKHREAWEGDMRREKERRAEEDP